MNDHQETYEELFSALSEAGLFEIADKSSIEFVRWLKDLENYECIVKVAVSIMFGRNIHYKKNKPKF